MLNSLLPRSLYTRFLLITILPMALVQLVAVYMFYERHWESMVRNMVTYAAGDIAMLVRMTETASPEQRQDIFSYARKHLNLKANFTEGGTISKRYRRSYLYKQVEISLKQHFDYPVAITSPDAAENVRIFIQMPGGLLDIAMPSKRLENPTTYIFTMWMLGSAALITLIAVLFLRNQVRSILRLSEAAEKFGKGHDMPEFKPQGAKEIRLAAIAFIEMRERIRRLIDRRTQMLAGVSHDLRTPLTRMRLQLAMQKKSKARTGLLADIEEMERMLESYLDFARGESREQVREIDLRKFLAGILKQYRNHAGEKECKINENIVLHGKPELLKRCFFNLIDNALRYGSYVLISAEMADERHVSVFIDDNGPGIPADKRREVFQPFYRLEQSRNRATGGLGLGLAIAEDIVHKHGGQITLEDSPLGGLRVSVTLPV